MTVMSLYQLGIDSGRCRRWESTLPQAPCACFPAPPLDSSPGLLLLLEGSSTVHRNDLARDVVSLSHQEQDGPGDVHR